MRRPAGSWSNDQLSSAFTAPAARLSSRTVQQNQRWSPELPYSSRTGPAQQRADHAAKSRHLTSATQVAGAKNLPAWRGRTTPAASYEPPPLRRAVRGGSSAAPCDPPTPGWPPSRGRELGGAGGLLPEALRRSASRLTEWPSWCEGGRGDQSTCRTCVVYDTGVKDF